MGRIKSKTTAGFTTGFDYDSAGNLIKSHCRDRAEITYELSGLTGWFQKSRTQPGNSFL